MLIYPYRVGSQAVRALRLALPAMVIKREASKLKGRSSKTIINWGASELPPEAMRCKVLNRPEAVLRASQKLLFFQAMEGTELTPSFCTGLTEASRAISDWGMVVCRTILQGHSGAGIILASKSEELVPAPLYVQYIKKTEEFRVHVIGNKVVDTQRKARRNAISDDAVNWQIRNHQNGFVYARDGVEEWATNSQLKEAALRTVEVLGLDFGAVDIIYNQKQDKFYVLEVNTAPGLEGSTVQTYAQGLRRLNGQQ